MGALLRRPDPGGPEQLTQRHTEATRWVLRGRGHVVCQDTEHAGGKPWSKANRRAVRGDPHFGESVVADGPGTATTRRAHRHNEPRRAARIRRPSDPARSRDSPSIA